MNTLQSSASYLSSVITAANYQVAPEEEEVIPQEMSKADLRVIKAMELRKLNDAARSRLAAIPLVRQSVLDEANKEMTHLQPGRGQADAEEEDEEFGSWFFWSSESDPAENNLDSLVDTTDSDAAELEITPAEASSAYEEDHLQLCYIMSTVVLLCLR